MDIGLYAVGLGGNTSQSSWIEDIAKSAEQHGFHTLWAGEHIVMFDDYGSRYPFSPDGTYFLPGNTELLDPFISLAWVASMTRRLRVGTFLTLLPLRNPVVLAKQVATFDHLARGRFTLGVGVGWLTEEYNAVGVPVARRAARMEEYVRVMRALWANGAADFDGDYIQLRGARCHPKPHQSHLPVLLAGSRKTALERVASIGDGWLAPPGATADEIATAVGALHTHLVDQGRPDATMRVVATITDVSAVEPDDIRALEQAGVTELIVTDLPRMFAPGADPDAIVHDLADQFLR